jgi:hypothetical protein
MIRTTKLLLLGSLICVGLIWSVNKSNAANGAQGASVNCNKKGSSGACGPMSVYIGEASNQNGTHTYQAWRGNINLHLDGHGSFGGSGGTGGMNGCLTKNGAMWSGACWTMVDSGPNAVSGTNYINCHSSSCPGRVGDGEADYTDGGDIGTDYTQLFKFWTVEFYANDAAWTGTYSVDGRLVEAKFTDYPTSMNVGGTYDINWSLEYATDSNFSSSGPISCDGSGNCTATGTGTAQITITAHGPSGIEYPTEVSETKSITINAINSPPPNFTATAECFGWPSPAIEVNFPNVGATSYELQKSVNGGSFAPIFSGNYTQMDSYADSSVSAPNSYSYFVRAFNSAGSTDSNHTQAITVVADSCSNNAPTPPPPPPSANCTQNALLSFVTPLPSTVVAGKQYPLVIRMTNTGNTQFSHGSLHWKLQPGPSSSAPPGGWWGLYAPPYFDMNTLKAGGQAAGVGNGGRRPGDVGQTPSTTIFTAPATLGTYTLTWQMSQDNVSNLMEYAINSNPPNTDLPDLADCTNIQIPPPQGAAVFFGNEISNTITIVAPPPQSGSGNIFVNSDTPTSWTVTGATTSYQGAYPSTTATYANAPAGNYSISAQQDLPGYVGPEYLTAQNQNLVDTGSITFNLSYLATPTNLSLALGAQCLRVNLNWTDNANNETGYQIWRSIDGQASWQKIADRPANTTSYADTAASGNNDNYYTVRVIKGSLWTQPPVKSIFVPSCSANIGNSGKIFYNVNGVAFTPQTVIQNSDRITYKVTIVNSNLATDSAFISGITDTLSIGNQSAPTSCPGPNAGIGPWCLKINKNGNSSYNELAAGETGSITGSAPNLIINITGNMTPGTNWVVLFDTIAAVSEIKDPLFKNTAFINCTSVVSGESCSVTRIATFLNSKGGGKTPIFKEVAP